MHTKLTAGQIVKNEKLGAETTYHGIDPSTEKALWECPVATEKDLDVAVIAANNAFKTWSKLPVQTRSNLVETFADGLEKYKDELTDLLHKETGKPV